MACALGSSQYIKPGVNNVEAYVSNQSGYFWKLTTKSDTPLKTSYLQELDVYPGLKPSEAAYFQSLIGVLHWFCELGIIDICLEVSMMSSHIALPREGHLIHLLQIFSYLCKYHNSELVLDPSDPVIDTSLF